MLSDRAVLVVVPLSTADLAENLRLEPEVTLAFYVYRADKAATQLAQQVMAVQDQAS
jgi:hypothetical protein